LDTSILGDILRIINRTLVALLVIALMPAQEAWGQQFVPEGVDESKGDVAFLVRDIFTSSQSFVHNQGEKDAFGNRPFCASLTSETCSTSPTEYLRIFQTIPLCSVDATASCIEGLDVYSNNSQPQAATFVRNVSGVQFPGDKRLGIPAAYTPAIWDAPSHPNVSGSSKYVTSVQIRWIYRFGKVSLENFFAVVHPVQEIQDQKFGPSGVGTETRNGKTFTYLGAMNNGYTTEECATTDVGYCAKVVDFAENTRVGLKLRISKELTGWLQGRISKPSLTVTSISSNLDRVEIDASPVEVPQLYAETQVSNLPGWLQGSLSANFGSGGRAFSDRQWRIYSSEGEQVVRVTRALVKIANDRAAHVSTSWNVSSLQRVTTGNRCLDNPKRLVGLVTTNALAYNGGAPRFRNGFLSYQVAGAHYLPDGTTKTEGTYDLALRSETARCLYGFSRAPISATISVVGSKGERKFATTIVREKAGWLTMAAYGFTFSSPTIKVKLTQKR